jgi:ESCRT-II complex subunit VPS25
MEAPAWWAFPPSFTLQPVADTRAKQVAAWGDFVVGHCRRERIGTVPSGADDGFPLFENRAIGRKLNTEARLAVLEGLVKGGRGEWLDKGKSQCLVFWRKQSDLARMVWEWAQERGLRDSVFSVDELIGGEDSVGAEFHGLPREVMQKVLLLLEEQGKVRMFQGAEGDDDGVKFL